MLTCFTVPALIHALIILAVIAFVIFVIRLVLPIILGWLGIAGGVLDQIMRAFLVLVAIVIVLMFLLWVWECFRL